MKFRVCWAASSNVSFRGHTSPMDVADYLGDDDAAGASLDDVEMAVGDEVQGIAIDASGFECWIEMVDDSE